VLPYGFKIGFGVLELSLLVLFFSLAGREPAGPATPKHSEGL
jgi:hypothetical protein